MARNSTGEKFTDGVVVERYRFCSRCGEELEWESRDYYCKECRADYNRKYKADHKEEIAEKQRDYRARKHYRQFVYIIWGRIDGMVVPLYIGSTKRPRRTSEHLSGRNGTSAEQWVEFGIHKVEYADVTELVDSRAEREYLEELFIEELEPMLNKRAINSPISEERMEELSEIMYNELVEFRELEIIPKTKKTSSGKEEIFFNTDDLIFEY